MLCPIRFTFLSVQEIAPMFWREKGPAVVMPDQPAPRPDERRAMRRFPSRLKMQARLSRATEEGTWLATVRNISLEGIGLLVNRPIKAGMFLTLELPVQPPMMRKPILIKVMHAKAHTGNKWWNVGGAFIRKLTKEELDALKSRTPLISPPDERRTAARHTTRLKSACPLVRATEEGPWWVTIRNISMKGIGLIAARPFKHGMFLTLELPTPDGKLGKQRLLKLTNCRPQPGNKWWVLGGQFLTKLTKEELVEVLG
jgi:hypothetical protein